MSGPYEGITHYALAAAARRRAEANPPEPAPSAEAITKSDAAVDRILADVLARRLAEQPEPGSLAAKLSLTRRVGGWQRRAR